MTRNTPQNSAAENISAGAITKFAGSLHGEIILPDDPRYQSARRVWNRAVDQRPTLIVRCAGEEDVVRAVDFARRHGLLTAVRGGGHSFAGHGVCDGGMVIDLSFMKRVEIDPMREIVTIEAGVVAGELDDIAQAFGLAVPLGSCPSVGVAGYSLGGGEGSLTPKYGYGCDSINAVEIVTADGQLVEASASENQDLFWAVRGAGANFGLVTLIEFRLHRIETVLAGHLKYPIRQAAEVLRFIDGWALGIPDELFLIAAMLPFPGERMLDVGVVWPGEEKAGERALAPLRDFMKPAEDSIMSKLYIDEQHAGSDTPAKGDYASHRRGGHFERLSADTIEVIVEHAGNAPSVSSGITMIYWHGPWCSKPHDNAFGFRRTGYEYWVHSYWQDPAENEKSFRWVEEFFAALQPLSTGAVYLNDLENESADRVIAAYGNNYERLRQIKRRYDPGNFFRVNQNIEPAA